MWQQSDVDAIGAAAWSERNSRSANFIVQSAEKSMMSGCRQACCPAPSHSRRLGKWVRHGCQAGGLALGVAPLTTHIPVNLDLDRHHTIASIRMLGSRAPSAATVVGLAARPARHVSRPQGEHTGGHVLRLPHLLSPLRHVAESRVRLGLRCVPCRSVAAGWRRRRRRQKRREAAGRPPALVAGKRALPQLAVAGTACAGQGFLLAPGIVQLACLLPPHCPR